MYSINKTKHYILYAFIAYSTTEEVSPWRAHGVLLVLQKYPPEQVQY